MPRPLGQWAMLDALWGLRSGHRQAPEGAERVLAPAPMEPVERSSTWRDDEFSLLVRVGREVLDAPERRVSERT